MPIKIIESEQPSVLTRLKAMRELGGNDLVVAIGGPHKLSGGEGDDTVFGGALSDTIVGGRGQDLISGGNGNDRILDGSDRLLNNDVFFGGQGNDRIRLFGGADLANGGDGNDLILSRSDAGEPIPFADSSSLVNATEPLLDGSLINDTLIGGEGNDRFVFNPRLDARYEIAAKHADLDTGVIDWQAVAGENDNIHDHWVEGIGTDTILDYNSAEDTIVLRGHTVAIAGINLLTDDDGVPFTEIRIRSDQGADGEPGGGAHDFDDLGAVHVYGDTVSIDDIVVNAGVFDGMYKRIDQFDGSDAPLLDEQQVVL